MVVYMRYEGTSTWGNITINYPCSFQHYCACATVPYYATNSSSTEYCTIRTNASAGITECSRSSIVFGKYHSKNIIVVGF